jgi:hypothetical protein
MAAASIVSSRSAGGDHRNVAEGLGCWRTRQFDWCEPVVVGNGARSLLLTGRGITLGSISADFEAMNRAIALHRLRPVIDRTFPFAEANAAYRHFEGRGRFGKVVIAQADDIRHVPNPRRGGRRPARRRPRRARR